MFWQDCEKNHLFRQLMAVFNVQFMQCFNVLIYKGNWYYNEIFFALLYIALVFQRERTDCERVKIFAIVDFI